MEIEKRAYSTADFCAAFGVGKTKLYELMAAGAINARKADGKTLIPHSEGERWLASLPSYAEAKRRGGPGRGHTTLKTA